MKIRYLFILCTLFNLSSDFAYSQPAEDNCSNAQVLLPNPDINTYTYYGYTDLAGATPSSEPNLCSGIANNDVWFQFVATTTYMAFAMDDLYGIDLYHSVYEGTCGNFTNAMVCADNPDYSPLGPLNIGQTYYIRIYTASNTNPAFGEIYVYLSENITPPINDDCANAINLIPSFDGLCGMSYSGFNSMSTTSQMSACGTGDPKDDVWFQFVATTSQHHVELSPLAANNTTSFDDYTAEIYTGSCGSLTLLACEDLFLTGLSIGTTYYIRVYNTSQALAEYPYSICVTSPPQCISNTPPNDFCGLATVINSFYGYCGTTLSSYTIDEMTNFCSASVENNSWLSFTASDPSVSIKYWITGGSSCGLVQGVQFAAFSGSCGNLSLIPGSCINASNGPGNIGFFNFSGLTVGQQYYIMIDGFAGDVCDYLWQAQFGIISLSVELSKFEVKQINNRTVQLDWEIQSEINNDYFTIERSEDGQNWTFVGITPGAGNSTNVAKYQINDHPNSQKTQYYRLSQTDYDGLTQILDLRSVKLHGPILITIDSEHYLQIIGSDENSEIQITNLQGNIIVSEFAQNQIYLGSLVDGYYIISVKNQLQEESHQTIYIKN